jgi:hypothetical protein
MNPSSPEPVKPPLGLIIGFPPLFMFVGTLMTNGYQPGKIIGYFVAPALVLLMILCFSPWFVKAIGHEKFTGTGYLLAIGYFIGQFILCLSLWIGSCAIINL